MHSVHGDALPRALPAVLFACLCSGCALAPQPTLPEPTDQPVMELPGSFAATAASDNHQPLEWWRAFNDPVLDDVVETVLASSFDIAGAVARVQQARVRAGLAEAPILPVVRAGAGVDSSLSGAVGLQTTDVGGLFNVQQWFGNLISNLLAPVFDGDRLAGNVALAHARFNVDSHGRTRNLSHAPVHNIWVYLVARTDTGLQAEST